MIVQAVVAGRVGFMIEEGKRMPDYCYEKHYDRNQMGSAILLNPEPLERYNQSRYELLIHEQENRESKLQILSEFCEICDYDIEHAIYPEPFGYFDSEDEKKELRRISILNQNFVNYLGAIYAGVHKDTGVKLLSGFPSLGIDFNEVQKAALTDYFAELHGVQKHVRIFNPEENTEAASAVTAMAVAYTGAEFDIPSAESDKRIKRPPHAVSATYILPALLEQTLSTELENSIIYTWLDGMDSVIIQDEYEKSLFEAHKRMRHTGHGLVTGDRRKMMIRIWDIGEKYGVLIDSGDIKQVMYGKNKSGEDLTLGDIISKNYTSTRIRPQYLEVLKLLFGRKNLNLRNKIAHGDRSSFDYLHIGYVAIMYQLLIDIAAGDVFI